jgi:hypothetical protein
MWTTTLARPHRRTSAGSASHGRPTRTLRSLEDRLAAFRHDLTRRRSRGRTHWRRIHRTRAGLRHDQPSRRSRRRCARCRLRRLCSACRRSRRTRFAALSRSAGARRGYSMKCWRCGRRGSWGSRSCLQGGGRLGCRNFGHRNRCLYGFSYRRLLVDQRLNGLGRFGCGLYRRCRRLGRNDHCGRRTSYRLRRDKARRRFRRLDRSSRLRNGSNRRRRLRRRNRRTGRSWRRRRCRMRRGSRLSRPLRDRLQHIARLGDVRQVDLGLELVGRSCRGTGTTAGTGLLLCKKLLHALRFIMLDGTGVRFLFGDTDLGQNVEDFFTLYLEFSGQVINSNLVLHYAPFPPLCPVWVTPS